MSLSLIKELKAPPKPKKKPPQSSDVDAEEREELILEVEVLLLGAMVT